MLARPIQHLSPGLIGPVAQGPSHPQASSVTEGGASLAGEPEVVGLWETPVFRDPLNLQHITAVRVLTVVAVGPG